MWGWFQRKASAPATVVSNPSAAPDFFFQVKASALSDQGVREANEDTVCVLPHPDPRLRSVRMVGLADGMGGHAAGEVASRTCLQACADQLKTLDDRGLGAQLLDALNIANQAVWQTAQGKPSLTGMGTTLCLLAFEGNAYQFGWIGDSRIYRLRGGMLQQLTHDDTVVNALLAQGLLNPEGALKHPERHVLSQALGTSPELACPHLSEPEALRHDDVFLLTSDGVHGVLEHQQIAQLLGADIHASAQRIIDNAKRAGSQDNLSAVVVHVQRKAIQTLSQPSRPGNATMAEVGIRRQVNTATSTVKE